MGAERRGRGQRGMSLLELLATATIMAILASAVLPLATVALKRQKEIELRRALREMRTAIDAFRRDCGKDPAAPPQPGTVPSDPTVCNEITSDGYPKDLEMLVEGVKTIGPSGKKRKYLRRIPKDPMTSSTEWGLRCYQDDADSDSWCGSNTWDVYTKSTAKGLDGTPYREW